MEQEGGAKESVAQLLVLSGSFFFIFLGTGALQQFLLPILGTRAGMSDAAGAAVFACVYFAGPVFLAVYGYVYQALKERWCLVLGTLTYTLFAVVVLVAPDPAIVLGAAILWGFGAETIWATGPTQVINASPQSRYGSVSGIFQSATYSGQMLGVVLLGTMLGRYADPAQGQTVILATAAAISLVGNVLALFLKVKPKTLPPARLSDAFQALRSLAGRYLVLLSVATYLGWGLVLSSFTLLIKDLGQDAKLHWIVLPYYAGRLLVAWAAGRTSDRVGRERVMLAGFALGTAGLILAALSPSAATVAAVSAVLGMQAAMVAVASAAAVGDYIPDTQRHLVFAGTNAWGYLAAGGTMVVSQLLRRYYGDFTPSFLLFAGFYGACALLVIHMRVSLAGRAAGSGGLGPPHGQAGS